MLARRPEQAEQLRPAHLGEGAAHELPFLRRDQHVSAVEAPAPDDHSVIEGRREVEQNQMWALHSLRREEELDEAARIEQARQTLAGGRKEPTRGIETRGAADK